MLFLYYFCYVVAALGTGGMILAAVDFYQKDKYSNGHVALTIAISWCIMLFEVSGFINLK